MSRNDEEFTPDSDELAEEWWSVQPQSTWPIYPEGYIFPEVQELLDELPF